MRKEIIDDLLRSGAIRTRQYDRERIASMINSAETDANEAKKISISEETANIIFKSIYDSVRQLADAQWWLLGYEPIDHKAALESIKEIDIEEKTKLNFLDRFRKIRNDASYRGFRVSAAQAKEIVEFWDKCGKETIQLLRKQIK